MSFIRSIQFFVFSLLFLSSYFAVANVDLSKAAYYGKPSDILAILKESNVDINYMNADSKTTALMLAANAGRYQNVQTLIDSGAKLNLQDAWGRTALHHATEKGYGAIVELLAKKGADLEIANRDGRQAIHLAFFLESLDTAKTLLNNGVKLNFSNEVSRSLLAEVAEYMGFSHMELIVSLGADLNAPSYYGSLILNDDSYTPLMRGIQSARDSQLKAKFLIDKGADVNIQSDTGMSALIVGVCTDNVEIVKLLIQKGALVNLRSKLSLRTALGFALDGSGSSENIEIIKILRQSGSTE